MINLKKAKTLTYLVSISAAILGLWGLLCFHFSQYQTRLLFENQSTQVSELLRFKLQEQSQAWMRLSELVTTVALEDIHPRSKQKNLVKSLLTQDDSLLAVRYFRKNKSQNKWANQILITRPFDDPRRVGSQEIDWLDRHAPIDESLEISSHSWSLAQHPTQGRILRWTLHVSNSQAYVLEIDHQKWASRFFDQQKLFSYLVNSDGTLLIQNDPSHYLWGEKLTHLPIVEKAVESQANQAPFEFYELPGGEPLLGTFQNVQVGSNRYYLITQTPLSSLNKVVWAQAKLHFLIGGSLLLLVLLGIGFFHRQSLKLQTKLRDEIAHQTQTKSPKGFLIHEPFEAMSVTPVIAPSKDTSIEENEPSEIFSIIKPSDEESDQDEEYLAS